MDAYKSKSKINIHYANESWSGRKPNCLIQKLQEKDGKLYCTFLSNDYQSVKNIELSHFKDSNWGPDKEQWQKDPEKCQKIAEERAKKQCQKTQPISHITTDTVLEMMGKQLDEIKNYNSKEHYQIFQNANEDVKFILDNNFISKQGILKYLSVSKGNSVNLEKTAETANFKDQTLLKKFEVNKNDKLFSSAEMDSKKSGESWYYLGGISLIFEVTMTIAQGKRFDINRIKLKDFTSKFINSEGNPQRLN